MRIEARRNFMMLGCLKRLAVTSCLLGCGGGAIHTGPSSADAGDGSASSRDASIPDGALDATIPNEDAGAPSDAQTDADSGDASKPADADAGASIVATITVDPSTSIGLIPANFVGLSYEKSHLQADLFRADNAPLIALFELLGPSLLRVGGNSVDSTVWQTFDAGSPTDGSAAPSYITESEVSNLAAFAKAANWKVLYGVNMKTSSADVDENEATYVATALGPSLFGFEIGNEPDLYTTVASSPGSWTYSTFKTDWTTFAAAIHAGAGAVPLTGPAAATHYATWTVPFAKDEASAITTLTQHYYVANGQSDASTMDLLLAPDPALVSELDGLADAATTNKIANAFRLSECNSFYNGGASGVSDAYGTALWVIDFLFENAEHGSSGANFHGGGNGTGYTPIADSSGNVVEARPIFYGMVLFSKAGQGTVLKTSGAPTAINFSAYAVAAAASTTNIILSNKDKTTAVHATVDVGRSISSASAMRLAGPSLSSTTGVTLGGVSIGADGGFAPNAPESLKTAATTFTIDIPPASAALVTAL